MNGSNFIIANKYLFKPATSITPINGFSGSLSGKYLSIYSNYATYLSTDAGSTWNVFSIQNGAYLGFSSSGKYIIASYPGQQQQKISSNYGVTWQNIPNTISFYMSYASISSDDGKYIYSTDNDRNLRGTSNFGTTWNFLKSAAFKTICNGSGQYLLTQSYDVNPPMLSTNFGSTWNVIPSSPLVSTTNSVACFSDSGQYIHGVGYSGGSYFYTFTSSDYGNTWSSITNQLKWLSYPGVSSCSCDLSGKYVIFAQSNLCGFYLSTDYGKTYNLINNVLPSTPAANPIGTRSYIYVSNDTFKYNLQVYIGYIYTLSSNANINLDDAYAANTGLSLSYPTNFLVGGSPNFNQLSAPSKSWSCIVSNNSGSQILAGISVNDDPGYIYKSIDSGITWAQTTAPLAKWVSIASSGTGTVLYGAANQIGIYISTNSGSTWTITSAVNANYTSVACDISGINVAAVSTDYYFGFIYTSSNSGTSWSQTSAPCMYWSGIASSSRGQYLAASANGNGLYVSSNYGSTWTQTSAPNQTGWTSIASDYTGKYLIACDGSPGYIYTSSNYGSTWVQQTQPGFQPWTTVSSNSTGQYLSAGYINGFMFLSSNYGASWYNPTCPQNGWTAVTMSSNGQYLYATSSPGYIYNFTNTIDINQSYSIATNFINPTQTSNSTKVIYVPDSNFCIANNYIYNCLTIGPNGCVMNQVTCNKTGQYIIGQNGYNGYNHIFLSSDYGNTWVDISGITQTCCGSARISPTGQYMYVNATYSSTGKVSTNYGLSWSNYTIPAQLSSISTSGKYVLFQNGVRLSSNYGITSVALQDGWATMSDSGQYIAAVKDYNGYDSIPHNIAISSNYGSTWIYKNLPGNPNVNVFNYQSWANIISCSSDFKYILSCSSSNVYLSTDSGSNWNIINYSFGPTNINSTSVNSTGQYMAVSTYGNQYTGNGRVYKSTDYGVTWNNVVNYNKNAVASNYMCISISDTGCIFAGSQNYTSSGNFPENYPQFFSDGTSKLFYEKKGNADLNILLQAKTA